MKKVENEDGTITIYHPNYRLIVKNQFLIDYPDFESPDSYGWDVVVNYLHSARNPAVQYAWANRYVYGSVPDEFFLEGKRLEYSEWKTLSDEIVKREEFNLKLEKICKPR